MSTATLHAMSASATTFTHHPDGVRVKGRKRRYAALPGTSARARQMDIDVSLRPRTEPTVARNARFLCDNLANLVDEDHYPRAVKKCIRSGEPVEEIRVRVAKLELEVQNKKRVRRGGQVVKMRKEFLKRTKAILSPQVDGGLHAVTQFIPAQQERGQVEHVVRVPPSQPHIPADPFQKIPIESTVIPQQLIAQPIATFRAPVPSQSVAHVESAQVRPVPVHQPAAHATEYSALHPISAMSWVATVPRAICGVTAANLWAMKDVQLVGGEDDDEMSHVENNSLVSGSVTEQPFSAAAPLPLAFAFSPPHAPAAPPEVWYDAINEDIDNVLAIQSANLALTTLIRTPPRNATATSESVAGHGYVPHAPEKLTHSQWYTSLFDGSARPSCDNLANVSEEVEFFIALEDNTPELDLDFFGASPTLPQLETPEHSLATLEEERHTAGWDKLTSCPFVLGAFDGEEFRVGIDDISHQLPRTTSTIGSVISRQGFDRA